MPLGRVFITGDTHGDFKRIEDFCERWNTTKDDTMIILGDAGINYYGDERDAKLKNRLNKTGISLFCIHGNHERRPSTISGYVPRIKFGGLCWFEPDCPGINFAIDGEVYYIAGKLCIAIGGAYSVDKFYRLSKGWDWFDDEQPSQVIKDRVELQLDRLGNKIDVVLSHTCPLKYLPTEMFIPQVDQSTVDKSTEEWLDTIEGRIEYDRWFCGHYHTDKTIDKMRFMFNDIIEFGDK